MGVKKSKTTKAKSAPKAKSVASRAISAVSSFVGGGRTSTARGGRRRSRMTVTKLVNRIAILKLKKKYNKLRYSGV
jgi:hypothetical protein